MTKEGNGVTMCHKLDEQERGNSEVEMNKQDPAGKVLTSVIVTSVNQEDSFFLFFAWCTSVQTLVPPYQKVRDVFVLIQ